MTLLAQDARRGAEGAVLLTPPRCWAAKRLNQPRRAAFHISASLEPRWREIQGSKREGGSLFCARRRGTGVPNPPVISLLPSSPTPPRWFGTGSRVHLPEDRRFCHRGKYRVPSSRQSARKYGYGSHTRVKGKTNSRPSAPLFSPEISAPKLRIRRPCSSLMFQIVLPAERTVSQYRTPSLQHFLAGTGRNSTASAPEVTGFQSTTRAPPLAQKLS